MENYSSNLFKNFTCKTKYQKEMYVLSSFPNYSELILDVQEQLMGLSTKPKYSTPFANIFHAKKSLTL